MRKSFSLFVFLLSFSIPIFCQAKSLYVNGYRELMLRTGPSLEHRIIDILQTGHEVNFIQEEEDFYLVSLEDGQQGYVLKAYMTEQTPAEHRLKVLEEKVQEQAQELAQLQQENARLGAAKAQAENEAGTQAQLLQQLQEERAEFLQDRRLHWFLAGAGVLLMGWLLGWSRVRLWRQAGRSRLSF